ncbi:MmgE/PrpD family protein [Salarchaeum sp. III]|uniref:MmgE/PrpD family protein n=1 Tax=Salarchaeum sp. III TaxID=3107927 RepID=UPI002EDB538E
MPTPETTLSEFVTDLDYDDIPVDARDTVQRAFLDTVGVTLAGAHDDAGETAFRTDGVTPDDALTILGLGTDRPATKRALHTGTASHALDYDDLAWAMDGHPSVTLVPPILALAADSDATGRDLVTAFAAGFELECALAAPISPDHYEDGWHATATFGAFGATAAAASLLDLTVSETKHALNTAASTPAGLKRNFGSMTKPLHAGLCARSGVTAARLAREGFTADPTAISSDRGFWDLYGPAVRDEFTFGPDTWALEERGIHVKYYPCCYFTHTSIAGTAALVDENNINPSDIERIHVRVAQGAADALHHADPDTGLEAKFSMEYTVASAAVRDRVGLTAFDDDAIDDPAVQRVRERVDFAVDDDLHYDSHEAHVRIDTADDSYERLQENPPGTHDNPLTDAELRAKFDECARRAVPEETADALEDIFTALADCDNVANAVRNASHP